MSKKFKVIFALAGMIISVVLAIVTIMYAKNTMSNDFATKDNSNMSSNTNAPNGNKQNMQTPPEKPSNDNSQNSNNSTTPPEMPSNDSSNNTGTPPQKPSDDSMSSSGIAQNGNNDINKKSGLNTVSLCLFILSGLIFSLSLLYLLFSKFGNLYIFQNKYKGVIYLLVTVILTFIISLVLIYLSNNYFLKSNQSNDVNNMNNSTSQTVEASAIYELSNDGVIQENKTYTSTSSDESCVLTKNNANLQLSKVTLEKTSGDTSNTENSEFFGINAALLTQKDSTTNITDSSIITSAKGANAVFATGENSKIYISNSNIKTTSDSSRGLDATYGGYIEADTVTISTNGSSCATLATDRGEGTVIAKKCNLSTLGKGSPIIYSTGDITLEDSEGISNGSQIAVVEGKNKATINTSYLKSSGLGNRNDVDNCGIMIYQSMSGDASEGVGSFTSKDSSLEILDSSSVYKTAPMFFVTNTDANISLENTKLIYGSNVLISAKGTNEWGTSGSNGANVAFEATNQVLTGDIQIDGISTLSLNLKNSSSYKGAINTENTAKKVDISIDSTSSWSVTNNSYVSTITLENNDISLIKDNGNNIYYNKDDNSWLNGKTVTLNDGGKLIPID